jgi:large-conductance mechanosensitive channel
VHSENYKPLVEDVIMPIVGLLTGGVDFTQKIHCTGWWSL